MRPGMTGGDSTFIREADEGTTRRVRQFFAAFAKALEEKNAASEPWIDTAKLLAQARLIAPLGLAYPNAEVYGGMTAQPWLVTAAHRDPDLGPILQGPAFARLREKHPRPRPSRSHRRSEHCPHRFLFDPFY